MVKSKRMEPIVNLAKNAERDAAKALGGALDALREQNERLQQLLGYRSEYQQRLGAAGSQGINAQTLNEYREFITKLGLAIEQQQQVVARAQEELNEKKRFWFARRGRCKALDAVLDRYLQQEQAQEAKREQRDLDERNNRSSQD